MLRRRQFQQLAAGALALPAVSQVQAQSYPAQQYRDPYVDNRWRPWSSGQSYR